MKLSIIRKRNKKIFESKINKKSFFLRSLPKKKYDSRKKVEEGKTELIIDKLLGIGEFERDYGFFADNKNNINSPKNILLNSNIKPSLKNQITLLVQKENLNKYDNYKKQEDIDKNYNSINIGKNFNSDKCVKQKNRKFFSMNFEEKNDSNKKQESFLSKIGNNIIISSSFFDKESPKKK